jgi:hypothetical protein
MRVKNMNRLVFSFLFLILSLFTFSSKAQDSLSIQINGGFASPIHSIQGLSGMLQFNYSINSKIDLYVYSGYSTWGKNSIIFIETLTPPQTEAYFRSYSSDNFRLIPIYIGGRVNLHTNKIFTSFASVELGYSLLNYTEYLAWEKVLGESGEVIDYNVNRDVKIEVNEKLFGIGIGAGVFRQLTQNLSLVLSFKLNSFVNSKYNGLFTGKGTYTMYLAGFNFSI